MGNLLFEDTSPKYKYTINFVMPKGSRAGINSYLTAEEVREKVNQLKNLGYTIEKVEKL